MVYRSLFKTSCMLQEFHVDHKHHEGESSHHDHESKNNSYEQKEDLENSKNHKSARYKDRHSGFSGEKGMQFHTDGQHQKGHSIKGGHIIRKKVFKIELGKSVIENSSK